MKKSLWIALAASSLAACDSQSERAAANPEPQKKEIPASVDIRTGGPALSQGVWRAADADDGDALLFPGHEERPLAAVRCDRASGRISVERMTLSPGPGTDAMKVEADGRRRTLPILWDGASLPIAVASLKLDDPMVDALARPSGRIDITLEGEPPLALPGDRALVDLVARCRSGKPATP